MACVISTNMLNKQLSRRISQRPSSPLVQQVRFWSAAKSRALRAQRLHCLFRIWRTRPTRPLSSTCEAAKSRTSSPTATRSRRDADGLQRHRTAAPHMHICMRIACIICMLIHAACHRTYACTQSGLAAPLSLKPGHSQSTFAVPQVSSAACAEAQPHAHAL